MRSYELGKLRELGELGFAVHAVIQAERQSRISAAVACDRRGHLAQRQRKVDDARLDRTARHAAELGLGRILDDRETAFVPDLGEAERSVGTGARQHDTDAARATRRGNGAEDAVDVSALRAVRRRNEPHVRVDEADFGRRRHEDDRVRLEQSIAGGLANRQRQIRLEQFDEAPIVARRAMHDDDERRAGAGVERAEQRSQSRERAGRSADRYDEANRRRPGGRPGGRPLRARVVRRHREGFLRRR
ncbi:MAG TPA: hypothetical protein VNA66_10705 [Gammaproteobacteria bacterium]|nr:hypothetical protein [Gammaproteobacteria bacterium]